VRTKNATRIDRDEGEHIAAVKSVACVLCDAPPPTIAHHVVQGDHFTTIAVCEHCHVGKHGVHGDQVMLRLRFKVAGIHGEVRAINETLRRVAAIDKQRLAA
jgi:hypothetical protein